MLKRVYSLRLTRFFILIFLFNFNVIAQISEENTKLPDSLLEQLNSVVKEDTGRLVDMFKDLHMHPELAFTEVRTAKIVANDLKRLGYTVTEGIAKTGVVGVLQNGAGPTIWFRADMDGISVKEDTGLSYSPNRKQKLSDGSEVDVMHACGHDAHVVWLLGMASAMVELRDSWSGTLIVYTQPAEEVGLGAQAMVNDGLWERGFPKPDYAFGSHTAPIPVGHVSSSAGLRMAGTDQLDITFMGKGGHGSTPQMTIDPIVMAAQAILSYQTIVSRNLDPLDSGVITVGAIDAGRDNNVIPTEAILKLNLRWFTPEVRNKIISRIDEINNGIAFASGVSPEQMPIRKMKGNAGPLVNNDELVTKINPALKQLLGAENVYDQFPPVMGSEDFQEAFNTLNVPYVFMLVGVAPMEQFTAARAKGLPFPYANHNPNFFVDLNSIPVGARVNTVAALSVLRKR
ncbi:amidohydrolase [Shewanella sp. DC2-4]|uniref:amidohydrolase n=1 Tax=Shewanella sp. DC2-4 TaxID=2739431 RepID=UPI001567797F|nr:amidohydrolase [Shewanella sp. DC2-4]NRD34693.1 amidohydrolase [Shewanella sp. DC2-4]